MERKDFIKNCAKLCMGGIVFSGLMESCTSNYYAINTLESNHISVKKTEFIDPKASDNKLRKYVLVRLDKLQYPISLYRLNENTYSALYMQCSHNSCELNPHGDYLICPCHGSEFTNLGVVQNPPAEANLKSFKVTYDNDNIYIHLS